MQDICRPALVKLSDAAFEREVIASSMPVLVDFSAEWCGPCRTLGPVLDELASELGGKIKIGTINIDENPSAALRYRIRGLPTLMIFAGGKVIATKVGTMPKSRIREWIESSI